MSEVFEYLRHTCQMDKYMSTMNKLGEEGWDCFFLDFNRETYQVAMFFKRRKPSYVMTEYVKANKGIGSETNTPTTTEK